MTKEEKIAAVKARLEGLAAMVGGLDVNQILADRASDADLDDALVVLEQIGRAQGQATRGMKMVRDLKPIQLGP